MKESITFVIPINNEVVYKKNFQASPLFQRVHCHQILEQRKFSSATKAYNEAIDKSKNDLIVFVHQDVIFPEKWIDDLRRVLGFLENQDSDWGVLGCYGVTEQGQGKGYLFCSGNGKILGQPSEYPDRVQTLDEFVLVFRKSSGLRFDDYLPHFHFYGTDICMKAASKGKNCYAINAFCLHNCNKTFLFPNKFFECYNHIRKSWRKMLPITTSCITVSHSIIPIYIKHKYLRQLKYYYSRIFGQKNEQCIRVNEPLELLNKLIEKNKRE